MVIKLKSYHKSDLTVLYGFLDVGLRRAISCGHIKDRDELHRIIHLLDDFKEQLEDNRNV